MRRDLKFMEEWNKTHSSSPSFDDAIKWADSNPLTWIKCSEQLPEMKPLLPRIKVSDYVLCYISDNYVVTSRLYNGIWEGYPDGNILAWMPIPKFK